MINGSLLGREFKIVGGAVQIMEAAAPKDGEKAPLRAAHMLAYTGGQMRINGWYRPVIVDLAGLQIAGRARPILKGHDSGRVVGHSTKIWVEGTNLRIDWVVSGTGADAREVVDNSANGFEWQASVGVWPDSVEEVKQGASAQANGRTFQGPVTIVRKGLLRESSVVALGADGDTSTSIAARLNNGDIEMDFNEWLKASGFEPDKITDVQRTALQAAFDALEASGADGKDEGQADAGTVAKIRADAAAEVKRIAAVTAAAKTHTDILEKAVEGGWDAEKTATQVELKELRANRPSAPFIGSGRQPVTAQVLEAGFALSAGVESDRVLKAYGEEATNRAEQFSKMGLRELCATCARIEGMDVPMVFGDGKAIIQAGFSTVSLPGVLENVIGKLVLQAYERGAPYALKLCKIGTVSNFNKVSRVRLLVGGFKKVAAGGELRHMPMADQKFTAQAETFGGTIVLTRQMVVNDDAGVLKDLADQIGQAGSDCIDFEFFTKLLANPGSFYHADNGNYNEGASTAFGHDSLSALRTLFRKRKAGPTAASKTSISVEPALLVVPPEIEAEAIRMNLSEDIMVNGAASKTTIGTKNVHKGKYEVVSPPHLSDDSFTGYSAAAYYLFADPNRLPSWELSFLNGIRTPTIARAVPPAGTLGLAWESYIDFGVDPQDPAGSAKSKGAA